MKATMSHSSKTDICMKRRWEIGSASLQFTRNIIQHARLHRQHHYTRFAQPEILVAIGNDDTTWHIMITCCWPSSRASELKWWCVITSTKPCASFYALLTCMFSHKEKQQRHHQASIIYHTKAPVGQCWMRTSEQRGNSLWIRDFCTNEFPRTNKVWSSADESLIHNKGHCYNPVSSF